MAILATPTPLSPLSKCDPLVSAGWSLLSVLPTTVGTVAVARRTPRGDSMSLDRHRRNLLLEGICLAILVLSLVLVGLVALFVQGTMDERIPRTDLSASKIVPLHPDRPMLQRAILGLGAGLGLAGLGCFGIRRYLVQPEPLPWEEEA